MPTNDARHPHSGNRAGRPTKDFVRAYMACEPCRKTKAKCEVPDPNAPCVRCNRERRECYFDTERSAKKRRKADPPSIVNASATHGWRPTVTSQEFASIEIARPHQSHHLMQGGGYGSTNGSNDSRIVQILGGSRTSFMDSGQQQCLSADHSESREYAGQSPKGGGASHAVMPAVARDSPQKSPQNQSRSSTMIDADVMSTYLSSSKDALGILFKAAEQQDTTGDVIEHRDSNSGLPFHDSPASAYTSGAVPAPILPSKLSSPAPPILEVWDACRFIRQGWFTAREAVTFIDLFFFNLLHFSPVLDLKYSKHENHKSLIYEEPLLCCTLLMISSRYHVLPGPGGASRAQFIHMRLWAHCEHLIKRLTFGQEKYSVAKSRTMGSIESLLLEGGQTENLSAKDLAELGFCAVAYPWTLVAAKLKSIRETLEGLKKSMTIGAPPQILSYSEVCEGVGFNNYWEREERYKFDENDLINSVAAESSNGVNGVR